MKPVIGVIPLWDSQRESLWMLPGYMDALMQAGALPCILPLTESDADLEQLADGIGALLLTGGQDVAPVLYREPLMPACGEICTTRDAMELKMVPLMMRLGKPILGICRGLQLLNVALGGTLWQDLPTQHPSPVEHHAPGETAHLVNVSAGTRLASIVGPGQHPVNSRHHQAIKALAPSLVASAVSEDGLVEAVELPGTDSLVLAVQWHPELRYRSHEGSMALFRELVNSCHR